MYTLSLSSELLWTAPEHLQETNGMICRVGSSQKGDVFSFGIILQEIALRAAPYEYNDLSVEGMSLPEINRVS